MTARARKAAPRASRGRVVAIVVAAGRGERLGGRTPKAFVPVAGASMLARSVASMASSDAVSAIVVVGPKGALREARQEAKSAGRKLRAVVAGGGTRADSVRAGLAATRAGDSIVLVHDAARPFVDGATILRVIDGARTHGASIPVVPVVDTIKSVGARSSSRTAAVPLGSTIDRATLAAAQTPQGFERPLLVRALAAASRASRAVTDEAMAVELVGERVVGVAGEPGNVKITTRADLEAAERRLAAAAARSTRVGHGFDCHRLVTGRPLVLGGVQIDSRAGLEGHSDGDALLHAICDALLGAAALGDLGALFPSSDPRWRGVASSRFVEEVARRIASSGYRVVNVDATVVAERPRLAPHLSRMRDAVASLLRIPLPSVSIKAKSADSLGAIGRGEGIAAHAVALIEGPPAA